MLAIGCSTQGSEPRALSQVETTHHPGDVIVLPDGTYKDQNLHLTGVGTADHRITFLAQTPGKVVFTGNSVITLDGQYLVLSGIMLKNGGAGSSTKGKGEPDDGIAVKGAHNRLTDCAVSGGTYKFLVHLYGADIHMDHCYLAGKTSGEPTLQIEAPGEPNNDHIEYNHFGHRRPLGRNGGETMRVGYSWQSMNNSRSLVEHNLFDRCDGEIEIISSKSCENTYRYNTFLDCGGMLTLRHGNRCVVDSNFFIAHHKKGSGGIRVIGEDHVIVNNYIEGVEQGGFWITSGLEHPPLKTYFAARNCVIAFNTFVDSAGPAVDLDAGFGSSNRTVMPQDITIANNILSPDQNGAVLKGKAGPGYAILGNLSAKDASESNITGIRAADLGLQRGSDGLWRPTANPTSAVTRLDRPWR